MKAIKTLSISLLITLCACHNPNLDIATMPKPPQYGPPDYQTGWKAGCETGMGNFGNSYMRTRYRTHIDAERMRNNNYNKGWELGQRYCAYYVSTYLSNTEMAALSNDNYTKSDLRSDNTWFKLKSDGFFSYQWKR